MCIGLIVRSASAPIACERAGSGENAFVMETGGQQGEILSRVELILRRDLKLGGDVLIGPASPFFGGAMDLDSLDILLLVTSVEKEFGVKIPSDAVGKEVFQTVQTLVDFIARQSNSTETAMAASGTGVDAARVDHLARLPHGAAFRFVSRVTEVREEELAEGVWAVTGDEPFFAGHFPGRPIVPGVLLAEALAQISGLACAGTGAKEGGGGMLAHVDVRFNQPIVPPAEIVLRSKLTRSMGALQQFEVEAAVGGVVAASGSIALHRTDGSGT